jgi:glutamate 5-kinase
VRGGFEKGDSIRILDLKGGEIGVGLANYGSDELVKILGEKNREEIVHRDNLVLYES